MLTDLLIDTTRVPLKALTRSLADLVTSQRPSLLIFDGLPGTGKSTLANLLRKRLKQLGLHVETIGLDDEKTSTSSKVGKCGLDLAKDRSVELVRDHIRSGAFETTLPIYRHSKGEQSANKTYCIPGKQNGVLLVEGLGAQRVLKGAAHLAISPLDIVVCRVFVDEDVRTSRRFSRALNRYPGASFAEVDSILGSHDKMVSSYSSDLSCSRSTALIKRVNYLLE